MEIPENVQAVLKTLESAGHEAWCVGGCVRDALLGRSPGDWDVAASAQPEETLAAFGPRGLPTGLKHGTVTVKTPEGPVEVTTYRIDGVYRDHRRPESVAFTRSLDEDLARRDFTINAMARNLRGELRDPFGGREDLRRGILRCVGDPDRRFQEDALRILRGLRFAAALGLEIEPGTAAVRMTRSQSPRLSALWPMATGMPRERRCFTVSLSDMSEPWMTSPLSRRTSARGHMDTPPMPTRWARVPGTKKSLIGFLFCIMETSFLSRKRNSEPVFTTAERRLAGLFPLQSVRIAAGNLLV